MSPYPFWDSYRVLNLISNFLWALVLFTLLELALRFIKDFVLALLIGAAVSALIYSPISFLVSKLFIESNPFSVRLLFLPFNILAQVLFALTLGAGLRMTSGRWPLLEVPPEPRVSRGFYVGTIAATNGVALVFGLALIIIILFTNAWELRSATDLTPIFLLLAILMVPVIYGSVVFCVLIYKMWQVLQDGYARTTPGWAVGGLFIPFYNFYWAFEVLPGFVNDYYAFAWRYGLYVPRLSKGVFTAYVIICIVSVIPYLNLLLLPAAYVLLLIMVSQICKAVNALPLPRPPLSFNGTSQVERPQ